MIDKSVHALRPSRALLYATIGLSTFFLQLSCLKSNSILFDEMLYGQIVDAYLCSHSSVINNHPPHGKLLLAAGAWISGYPCGAQQWSYGRWTISPLGIRSVPFISMFVLLFALWKMSLNLLGKDVARWIVILVGMDCALWTHARLALFDLMLLASMFGAIAFALWGTSVWAARRNLIGAVLTGSALGIAIGCKWSGLSAWFMIGLIAIGRGFRDRAKFRSFFFFLISAIFASLIYLLGWVVHLKLTGNPGAEDPIRTAFPGFWPWLWHMHILYYKSHQALGDIPAHIHSSQWWQWPFGWRPIIYNDWNHRIVALVGNPVLWTGSFLVFAFEVLGLLVNPRQRWRQWNGLQKLATVGWLANMLPFVLMARFLFLYHYFPALVFSLMFVVGRYWGGDAQSKSGMKFAIAAGVFFVILSPVMFGIPLPESWVTAITTVLR